MWSIVRMVKSKIEWRGMRKGGLPFFLYFKLLVRQDIISPNRVKEGCAELPGIIQVRVCFMNWVVDTSLWRFFLHMACSSHWYLAIALWGLTAVMPLTDWSELIRHWSTILVTSFLAKLLLKLETSNDKTLAVSLMHLLTVLLPNC